MNMDSLIQIDQKNIQNMTLHMKWVKLVHIKHRLTIPGTKKTDSEYVQLMQSLNLKQSELCAHVLKAGDTQNDQMCIFIEGGAGVGKPQVAKAIYHSLEKFYSSQPGENPDDIHAIILAPTGIAAYHINGNTIHSGLHIVINKKDATPLSYSELNTLRSKYNKIKAIFFDEISMVGRELFKESEKRLQEIMGTTKPFEGLHVLAIGDFFHMAPVMDSYIFKDDHISYGPLAINLWTTHFLYLLFNRNYVTTRRETIL